MSYRSALVAAGATVLNYEAFGSYQGTWLAFVEYNGEKGIVEGSYGSCSGCDAFEAEFGWSLYDEENTPEQKEALSQRLAEFGKRYLTPLYDKAHYERVLSKLDPDDWFDNETKEYCEWALAQAW